MSQSAEPNIYVKFEAEIGKMLAETSKLSSETAKISAETSRINRENSTHPWLPILTGAIGSTGIIGAIIALIIAVHK